jgi:hypothetical protein
LVIFWIFFFLFHHQITAQEMISSCSCLLEKESLEFSESNEYQILLGCHASSQKNLKITKPEIWKKCGQTFRNTYKNVLLLKNFLSNFFHFYVKAYSNLKLFGLVGFRKVQAFFLEDMNKKKSFPVP